MAVWDQTKMPKDLSEFDSKISLANTDLIGDNSWFIIYYAGFYEHDDGKKEDNEYCPYVGSAKDMIR